MTCQSPTAKSGRGTLGRLRYDDVQTPPMRLTV